MKQPVRSFALGLLTAGIILLITFYFTDDSKEEIDSKTTIDDMISSVESEGYHVLTDSEYMSISTQSDQNENNNTKSQKDQEKSTDENGQKKDEKSEKDTQKNNSASNEKDTTTYTLTVEPGMSSIKLSNVLMDNGIVDDAENFNQYLDAQGYSKKIQLGEYDLSSTMSQYEIAELISN